MGMMLGINIPKRGQKVTNGDVIKALFPDCTFSQGNSCSYLKFKGNLFTMAVEDAWWNAPYKEVENESKK